jgi:hypothetical protein
MTDTEFAKTHLSDHLRSLIVPPIAEGFWSIHKSSKELCERNGQPDQILRTFQNMLTKIPEWSDLTLATEVERIEKVTKCNYLDDLIMGVFISYMKSFASLHQRDNSKEIEIEFNRPSLALFVHSLYIHSARKLWQTAYLLNTDLSAELHARNRQEIEKSIGMCLDQVIREFLPWKAITNKYFGNNSNQPVNAPTETVVAVPSVEETKSVSFGSKNEDEDEDDEEDDEDDEDEEEEEQLRLKISDEDAVLDIPEMTTDTTTVDPMTELENKVSDTLVLNL